VRYAELFLPTLKETPAEAEVISHRLMLRAGLIRKLAAGIYSFLPLGYRVIRKIEEIIRQEMAAAGAQEVLLPVLQPAELWQESGRWQVYGPELMRIRDRHRREFCLGPTHEEVITDLVRREVRSYRQLPLNLYQIQTKFRDEIRPRFGLMRGREFIMKDGYSFDRDEAGAEESYARMYAAYNRIFSRCGLKFKAVEADTGAIGGSFSHEYMVLAESGEDRLVSCEGCGYAANLERAECPRSGGEALATGELQPVEEVATPGQRTVEEVTRFLGRRPDELLKTLVVKVDGKVVLALVRGDHEINLTKLKNFCGADFVEFADAETIRQVTGAEVGFAGPVGVSGVQVVADYATCGMRNFVTGANRTDAHLVNVNFGRDVQPEAFADIRLITPQDGCPRCGGELGFWRGIEVAHIFKLGTKYSQALGATYLDEQGQERLMVMGCYGIGVGRTMAAAIEQHHDEWGIVWPRALAPYEVTVVPLEVAETEVMETAEGIYQGLQEAGVEVLLDDRDVRPGVKFKDADLVGFPLRVTVGLRDLRSGVVEIRVRRSGERIRVAPQEAQDKIKVLLEELQ